MEGGGGGVGGGREGEEGRRRGGERNLLFSKAAEGSVGDRQAVEERVGERMREEMG